MALNDFLNANNLQQKGNSTSARPAQALNEPPTEILIGEVAAVHTANSGHVSVFARIEGQGLKGFTILPNWDIPVEVGKIYFFEVRDVKAYEHQYADAEGVHFYRSSARYIVKAAKTETQLRNMEAYRLLPN